MRRCIVLLFSFIAISTQADPVPVVDLNDVPESTTVSSPLDTPVASSATDPMAFRQSLPMDQRVKLLEQQMGNLMQMNLPAKVENLEQQIHQLNGQLEEQAHMIEQLQNQKSASKNAEENSDKVVATPPVVPKSSAVVATQTSATVTSASKKANVSKETTSKESTSDASPILAAEAAVVQNKAAAPAASPKDADTENAAEKAYQTALDLMIKKKNTQAVAAFKTFLKNYPTNTVYAPSAHYWLGELYSMDNKNALAGQEFATVIKQYPTHAKVPDALLKLAIIHDDAGQHAKAKQELQKLLQQFPTSKAAELAKGRLQGIKS